MKEKEKSYKMKNFPKKKYDVIYADPPWKYKDSQNSNMNFFSVDARYQTMNIEDIYCLPVNKISSKNCLLFLWVVSPLLKEGLETIENWGFKYKTIVFVWSKKSKNFKDIANLGRWTLGNVELCLLGTKGQPKRKTKKIRQLVVAKRKKHSQKPNEVRNRIELLCGKEKSKIELFARERYIGWDAWGNEVGNKILRRKCNLGIRKFINNGR